VHIIKQNAYWGYDMGVHLASVYGESYFAIGTEFLNTTFTAYQQGAGMQVFTATNRGGALTNSFEQTSMQIGVIHLTEYAEYGNEMATLLTSPQITYNIGLTYGLEYPELREWHSATFIPVVAYDVIIFVRDATPAVTIRVR